MSHPMRLIGPLAATVLLFGFSSPASVPLPPPRVEEVLFRVAAGAAGRAIQDSKWGPIGLLQDAVNIQAEACGVAPVPKDGLLGRETVHAVTAVAACRGVPAKPGEITATVFLAITGAPPPGPLDRARMIGRTREGTDYDSLQWNVCADWRGDAGSVLTWGPSGKTLGWGGELLGVLRAVDAAALSEAFAAEGARGLDRLLALKPASLSATNRHRFPGARPLMQEICAAPGQKEAWSRAFERLAEDPAVRAAYEARSWGEDAWFRRVVERLGRSWRDQGLEPTEIDMAFFIDRAIHMGWGAPRFAAVDRALAAAAADGALTNAEARFAVADAVRPTARPDDRMARDAIFLVDAEDGLKAAMTQSKTWPRAWKTAWRVRANVRASDVGLSDDRPAPGWSDGAIPRLAMLTAAPMPPSGY